MTEYSKRVTTLHSNETEILNDFNDSGFYYYDVWEDKPIEFHDPEESFSSSFPIFGVFDEMSRFQEKTELTKRDEAKQVRIRKEEKATEALLQKLSRRCPGCKVRTSKIGTFSGDGEREACHHMTCQNVLVSGEICKTEFCWRCGGVYFDFQCWHNVGCPLI